MSTDTPKVDMPPYVIRLERENARLRDELSLANGTIESRDRNIATLQEELAEAKRELSKFGPIDGNRDNTSLENWFPISAENLEQAEARALAKNRQDELEKCPVCERTLIDGDWCENHGRINERLNPNDYR